MSAESRSDTCGLLLAAGRGRRMRATGGKLLLDWPGPAGPRPLVAASLSVITPFCTRVYVTIGHNGELVRSALEAHAEGVQLKFVDVDPDAPMFDSIVAGLRAVRMEPNPPHRVMLHTADHPGVAPATVAVIDGASRTRPERAVMPEHDGKGGHPGFIPEAMLEDICSYSGEGGLRRFWELQRDHCVRIPVEDPSILRDVDDPDEYRRAVADAQRSEA